MIASLVLLLQQIFLITSDVVSRSARVKVVILQMTKTSEGLEGIKGHDFLLT